MSKCTCKSSPCTCCEKVISKQGPPGQRGRQGIQGPAGPSYVWHTSNVTPYDYIAAAWEDILTRTISDPGNYMIMVEGTVYPDAATSETFNMEIRKNGVAITGAQDQVKYNVPTPNESKKYAINTCVLNLAAGDIITFSVQSGKDMTMGHRSMTLVKVTNLTIF